MNVSVVIPCYNCANTIADAVQSACQNNSVKEIICVNDGSTDETLETIIDLSKQFPSLKYFTIDNGGPARARNAGIEKAIYESIALLDADDLFIPGTIDARISELKGVKGRDNYISISNIMNLSSSFNLKPIFNKNRFQGFTNDILKILILSQIINNNTPTMIFSKKLWFEIGGFDERLRNLEDVCFLYECLKVTNLHISRQVGVIRRMNENSHSNTNDYFQLKKNYATFVREQNLKLLEQSALSWPIIWWCIRRLQIKHVLKFNLISVASLPMYLVLKLIQRLSKL